MNQFSFKPRVLLLATAFAAASIVNAQTTDSTPAATATAPAASMDGKAAPSDVTSMDRTILAASGSAAHSTKAAKSKPASTNKTQVASATSSRTQGKDAASANPADTAYRAELRNCVQMQGGERDSCLDRAIEHHATS